MGPLLLLSWVSAGFLTVYALAKKPARDHASAGPGTIEKLDGNNHRQDQGGPGGASEAQCRACDLRCGKRSASRTSSPGFLDSGGVKGSDGPSTHRSADFRGFARDRREVSAVGLKPDG